MLIYANHDLGESETPGSPTTGLTAVQRKKKPKRRSTGVLSAEVTYVQMHNAHAYLQSLSKQVSNIALQDIEPRSEESADEVSESYGQQESDVLL